MGGLFTNRSAVRVWSVDALVHAVASLLETELPARTVGGEISGLWGAASGHRGRRPIAVAAARLGHALAIARSGIAARVDGAAVRLQAVDPDPVLARGTGFSSIATTAR